jgi:hypothetical protein
MKVQPWGAAYWKNEKDSPSTPESILLISPFPYKSDSFPYPLLFDPEPLQHNGHGAGFC